MTDHPQGLCPGGPRPFLMPLLSRPEYQFLKHWLSFQFASAAHARASRSCPPPRGSKLAREHARRKAGCLWLQRRLDTAANRAIDARTDKAWVKPRRPQVKCQVGDLRSSKTPTIWQSCEQVLLSHFHLITLSQGSLRPTANPGDNVCITDQINTPPLRGQKFSD